VIPASIINTSISTDVGDNQHNQLCVNLLFVRVLLADAWARCDVISCTRSRVSALCILRSYCISDDITTATTRSLPHAHYNLPYTMYFTSTLAVVLLGSSVQAFPVTSQAVRRHLMKSDATPRRLILTAGRYCFNRARHSNERTCPRSQASFKATVKRQRHSRDHR